MVVAELFAELGITIDEASMKKADAWLKQQTKKSDDFGKKFAKNVGGALSSLGKGLIAGAGAAFLAGAKDALEFDKQLTALEVASQGAMGTYAEMRTQILGVSAATGVAKEQVAAGAAKFVEITGNGKAASASMRTLADVTVATGASMEDVASSAAAMIQNLKIDPKDLRQAFSILIHEGKSGAIELKDVAGLMSSLAASSEQFANSHGVNAMADLGAALQVARKGFGDASETATGLQALMGAIVLESKKLEKNGVKVFNRDAKTGVKSLKPFHEIVDAIGHSAIVKDPTLLSEVLGRREAIRTFNVLSRSKGEWNELRDAAKGAQDLTNDAMRVQSSSAAKAARAWNDAKLAITEAFTPERVETFAKALSGVATLVGKLVDGITAIIEMGDRLGGGKNENLKHAAVRSAALARGATPAQAEAEANKAALSINRNGAEENRDTGLIGSDDFSWSGVKSRARGLAGQGDKFLISDELAAKAQNMFPGWDVASGRARTGVGAGATVVNLNSQVTVNANGVDPAGVVRIAHETARDHVQGMLRDAQAAGQGSAASP